MTKGYRGTSESALPTSQAVPPILHAVGGSLGSALALLLFYPLERARIELQSKAAQSTAQVEAQTDDNLNLGGARASSHVNPAGSPNNGSWVECSTANEQIPGQEQQFLSCESSSWSISSSTTTSEEEASSSGRNSVIDCLVQLQEHGELYRGVSPVITTMAASNFVFFYAHALAKRYMISPETGLAGLNQKCESPSITKSLLASSLAGIVNVLVTNPLWVANLRIVQGESTSSSLLLEVKDILRSEGMSHLWNGTWASLLLVSNPVIQFFTYEQLKSARLSKHRVSERRRSPLSSRVSPLEAFLLGAIAKAAATIVTYPLQLAQVLLRSQQKRKQQKGKDASPSHRLVEYKSTLDCFQKLYRTGGVPALFKGMDAKLLQTVLTAAFTFLTYEQILRVVRAAYLVLSKKRQRVPTLDVAQ